MHPVLFRIPVPQGVVSVAHAAWAFILLGLVVFVLGRRAAALDLAILGAGIALAAVYETFRAGSTTFGFGPIPIYGFGAALCGALVGGWTLTLALGERDGWPRDVMGSAYFTAAVSGILGARLLYVLTNLGEFHSLSDVIAFRSGGLVFYGGVLGGFLGALAYVSKRRVPWLAFADVAAPTLALGSVLGRIGCYLAGCDYGVPLSASAPRWLARLGTFPRWPDGVAGAGAGAPAWIDQVLYRGLPLDAVASRPVHPTELYESVCAALLLGALLWLRPRATFRGQVFFAYMIGYGVLRFLLETVRGDPERGFLGPLSTSQWIALFTVSTAGAAWAMRASLFRTPLRVP